MGIIRRVVGKCGGIAPSARRAGTTPCEQEAHIFRKLAAYRDEHEKRGEQEKEYGIRLAHESYVDPVLPAQCQNRVCAVMTVENVIAVADTV